MIFCVPALTDEGSSSRVSPHFGRAPFFVLVDTHHKTVRAVKNRSGHREHGRCLPLDTLRGEHVDAVLCSGIGGGALDRLADAGIRVYTAAGRTVEDLVRYHESHPARELTAHDACRHHGPHGHGG